MTADGNASISSVFKDELTPGASTVTLDGSGNATFPTASTTSDDGPSVVDENGGFPATASLADEQAATTKHGEASPNDSAGRQQQTRGGDGEERGPGQLLIFRHVGSRCACNLTSFSVAIKQSMIVCMVLRLDGTEVTRRFISFDS